MGRAGPFLRLAVCSAMLVGLGMTACLVAVNGGAAAARSPSPHVSSTGTVTCTDVTATIKFKKPLVPAGTKRESAALGNLVVGNCTSGGSAVSATSAKATVTIHKAVDSCTKFADGFADNEGLTLTIDWSGGIAPTTVTFKSGTLGPNPSNTGFQASSGTATGLFATTGGATILVTLVKTNIEQLTACADNKVGSVSSLQIESGLATF